MTYSIKNFRYLVEKEELERDFYFAIWKKGLKGNFCLESKALALLLNPPLRFPLWKRGII
jgi:hypothetical protein